LDKNVFLPVIEIYEYVPWSDQDDLDIWDGDPQERKIDLEKFYDYITIVAIQRNLRPGVKGYQAFTQNMRVCTEEDFTSRGYIPDEGMKEKFRLRRFLCFDTKGPNNYIADLVNLYNADFRNAF